MDSSRILLGSEAPPWLVSGDWAIGVHYKVLRFAIFLNQKLDFWLFCLLAIPDSAFIPASSGSEECLIQTPESVCVPLPLLGLFGLC